MQSFLDFKDSSKLENNKVCFIASSYRISVFLLLCTYLGFWLFKSIRRGLHCLTMLEIKVFIYSRSKYLAANLRLFLANLNVLMPSVYWKFIRFALKSKIFEKVERTCVLGNFIYFKMFCKHIQCACHCF